MPHALVINNYISAVTGQAGEAGHHHARPASQVASTSVSPDVLASHKHEKIQQHVCF